MFTLDSIASGLQLDTFTRKVKTFVSYLEKTAAPTYIPNEHPADLNKVLVTKTAFKTKADIPMNVGSRMQYRFAEGTLRDAKHANKSRGQIKARAAFVDFENGWTAARIGHNSGAL